MHWPNLKALYESDRAANDALTIDGVAAKFNAKTQASSRRLTIIGLVDALGQSTAGSLFDSMDAMASANSVVREVLNVLRSGGDVDVHHVDFKTIVTASGMADSDKSKVNSLDANQATLGELNSVGGTVQPEHIEKVRGWL